MYRVVIKILVLSITIKHLEADHIRAPVYSESCPSAKLLILLYFHDDTYVSKILDAQLVLSITLRYFY